MFDRKLIPATNNALKQHLQNIYNQISASADVKSVIDKKVEKVNQIVKEKIVNTVTISGYFDQLWKQPDLKQQDKDLAAKLLEGIQIYNKSLIKEGDQEISKKRANLNIVNAEFQMTPFEEFNYQEKLKGIRKHKQLDIESDLFSHYPRDKEVLHALNRPFRSVPNLNSPEFLHYTSGLCDIDEPEEAKMQKAEGFVRKMKDDRKAFVKKMKQIEKTAEEREKEDLERYKMKEEQDQERREREKKQRLDAHIKLLKARSEQRVKESTKWEEDYKAHLDKKPLFKDIEKRFKQEVMMPELNDRKKKLQELRDFYKPMAREELLDHEKKYLKLQEEKEAERKEQLMENSRWIYQKPAYESKHHKSYAEEISKLRNQKENHQQEVMKKKERVAGLMEEVKKNHLPETNPDKEMERMAIIEKLKQRKDWRSRAIQREEDEEPEIDPKKLGMEYLKTVKEMVQKNKKAHKNSMTKEDLSIQAVPSDRNKDKAGATSQSEPIAKPRNYLAELRKENKIKDSNAQVDQIISNKKLDSEVKKNMLQSEIEKLEAKTKRKEEVKKYKSRKNIAEIDEDDEVVDMMYINTIKAKLEMLGS